MQRYEYVSIIQLSTGLFFPPLPALLSPVACARPPPLLAPVAPPPPTQTSHDRALPPQRVEALIAPVGAVLWLITLFFLLRKATRTRPATQMEGERRGDAADGGGGAQGGDQFSLWLVLLWTMIALMLTSGVLLAVPSWVGVGSLGVHARVALAVTALLIYVPYTPLYKHLELLIDAFLMEHNRCRP